VISEGRWEADNFGNVEIPNSLVAWDFQDSSSNYGELRTKALAQNNGATWLTAFAMQGALLSPLDGLPGFGFRTYGAPSTGAVSDRIASAYVQQALSNGQMATPECVEQFANVSESGLMVVNPCPLDKPFNDSSCGTVKAGEIDARSLVCGLADQEPLDDVAVALNGLHPKDVWLTRIEADLPRAALGEDLMVRAATNQEKVDNLKTAAIAKNVQVICGSEGGSIVPMGTNLNRPGPGGRENFVVLVGLGLVAIAAFARRRFVTA
jgi:hypothetical protein